MSHSLQKHVGALQKKERLQMIGCGPSEAASALNKKACMKALNDPEMAARQLVAKAKAQMQQEKESLAKSMARLKDRKAKKEKLALANGIQARIKKIIDDLDAHAARAKAEMAELKLGSGYMRDEDIEQLKEEVEGLDEIAEMVRSLDLS